MKKLLLALSMCCGAAYTYAAFQTVYGRDIVITDSIETDLYISAGTVRIDAPVQGDIFLCGGAVSINSNVSGDVLVIGGELIFNGKIDGSLRCGGGKVTILGIIGRDLVVVSGDIVCDRNSIIYGGVLGAGGNLSIDGTVKQTVQTYGNYTSIQGTVDGEVNCKGKTIFIAGTINQPAIIAANDIQIGDSAGFQNAVRYWDADGQVDFKNSLFGRTRVYDKALEIRAPQWKFLGFSAIILGSTICFECMRIWAYY